MDLPAETHMMNRMLSPVLSGLLLALVATAPACADETRAKIAVMETAFGKRGEVTSFVDAKNAGYSAIQMHTGTPAGFRGKSIAADSSLPFAVDPSILDSWRTASRKHDVEIVSLCAGCLNKCQIWDRDHEASMRVTRQTIDACQELRVPTMLFPFFGPSNFQTSDEALNGVANFMRELLPHARAKNVVIGIEAPVTTVRVLELLEMLEFPQHLKVYYDTGNLFEKEDIYQTIRRFGKQHFCEIHIKPAGHEVVGAGKTDLGKLAAVLDAIEYDNWLVYEASCDGKAPVANREGIERIVRLRKLKP